MSQPGAWRGYAGGAILVLAGAYQFSGVKRRLLAACDPATAARPSPCGLAGAVRTGLTHGLRCLGSSGALMAVLLVTGIMNLSWMAAMGAVCAAEKITSWRAVASQVAGGALLGLGLASLIWPPALRSIAAW